MKLVTFIVAAVVVAAAIGIRSASADQPTTAPSNVPATQPMVAVNKLCPVTGEAVDPKVPTLQYAGKTIGFCCSDCVNEFKADPEKYMAHLK
jgi:YHS domain-containing protein